MVFIRFDGVPAPSPPRTLGCLSAALVELPTASSAPSPEHRHNNLFGSRFVFPTHLHTPNYWKYKSHLLYTLVISLQRSDLLQGLVRTSQALLVTAKPRKQNLRILVWQSFTCQAQLLFWVCHLGLPYLLLFLYTLLEMFQHSFLKMAN